MKRNKDLSTYDKLNLFEKNNPEIAAMHGRFLTMTKEQWAARYQEWDRYYKQCRESRLSQVFYAMGKEMHNPNKTQLRKLHAEAKELRAEKKYNVPPKTDDPYFFKYNTACSQYRYLLKQARKEAGMDKN